MLLFLELPGVRKSLFFSFSTKNSDRESHLSPILPRMMDGEACLLPVLAKTATVLLFLFHFPSKTVTVLNDSYGRLPSQRIFMGMGSMRSTRACSCLLERR